jgi:Flp pilus assembly protein TadG
MIRFTQRLVRDEGGASLIELALIMPFFASMVIGVVDLSRAYSAKLQLEQAAYRAIEKVQQYQASEDTYSTLSTEATTAATAAGFTNPTVTIDYWLECNGVRQGDGTPGNGYDTTCPTAGQTARWVKVDIAGKFTPMFASRHWPGANSDGTFTLHGKAGIRTQ